MEPFSGGQDASPFSISVHGAGSVPGGLITQGEGTLRLVIENVAKRYARDTWGLRNFSLALEPGVTPQSVASGAWRGFAVATLVLVVLAFAGRRRRLRR